MNIIYKKNNELTNDEIEVLYSLYYENIEPYAKSNTVRKHLLTLEHKEKWINSIKSNNSLISILCVDNGRLVGFILMVHSSDENYINEYHVCRDYQNDGITFNELMKACFRVAQPNKRFSGRIWHENDKAKKIFHKFGAKGENGKYTLEYDKAQEIFTKMMNS